ncbi:PrgI family protein [Candidatus Nomurabacteria bacterium]|nr:PrgI family protein [Candidatus Nomurabacteria bacterium]
MATYKVIQDVEAEDKILGPLSLKQLIFAAIAAGSIFIAFRIVVATGVIYTAIPFLPFILVFGVLAAPLGRDQPTEMWLAAQIRFYTKPRVRIWDQSGIKNLVNITAPIRIEKIYTDGLNQNQVRSRLKALASTLDSRGWAVKNVDVNMYTTPGYAQFNSDRIIDPVSLPITVSDIDVRASDDILDVANNDTAQHFDNLMQTAAQTHHQELMAKIHSAAAQQPSAALPRNDADDDALNYTPPAATPPSYDTPPPQQQATIPTDQPIHEITQEDEQKIIEHAKLERQRSEVQYASHHKVVLTPQQQADLAKQQALKDQEQAKEAAESQPSQQTHLSKTDTIELANANLKVSTIAGLAKHKTQEKQDPTEVVVKLH